MIEIKIPEEVTQEPCEDCISRESIKQKLQEQHDFFVNAYGGYSNLPQSDKSRVDEISNCIAMVVNEPSVTPKAEIEKEEPAEWIVDTDDSRRWDRVRYYCSACNGWNTYGKSKYCPNCGMRMNKENE